MENPPYGESRKRANTGLPWTPTAASSGCSRVTDGFGPSTDASSSSQRQLLQLLSIMDDGSEALKEKRVVEGIVDLEEFEDEHYFMKRARKADLALPVALQASPASPPSPISLAMTSDDLAKKARDFLFKKPFKIGRVFTQSGITSGTGWISAVPIVITCAHVVTRAGSEDLYFQLPDNDTLISLKVVFTRPEADYISHHKRDIAVLKMENVVGSNRPIASLPMEGISAGCLDWTCKCVTAGILPPDSPYAPNETQKMINCGTVKSESSCLVMTTSARADKGFSGGPLLNKAMEVIGMIQGDHGEIITTVKIIPIEEISNLCSILSHFIPNVPSIPVPMIVSGSSTF